MVDVTTLFGILAATYGAIITAFMADKVTLTSRHREVVQTLEKRIEKAEVEKEEERQRADRMLNYLMRHSRVTEELAGKLTDREARERENRS